MTAIRSPILQRHEGSGVERYSGAWSGQRTQFHAHPEYQLTLSTSGCGRFRYLGGEARIPVGCGVLFHPGEPHELSNAERGSPWQFRSFHIPAHWLESAGSPLLQPAPFLLDEDLRAAFNAVWSAFDAPAWPMAPALRRLAEALRSRPGLELTSRPRTRLVQQCLTHMAESIDAPLSMKALSAKTRAAPARIRRAVAAATGLSPVAWHLQRRIQESKHRLARGDSIAATALATGFSDQAHFTRHFKRLVGVSPAVYVAGVQARG